MVTKTLILFFYCKADAMNTKVKANEKVPPTRVTASDPEIYMEKVNSGPVNSLVGNLDEETIKRNRENFFEKMSGGKKKKETKK